MEINIDFTEEIKKEEILNYPCFMKSGSTRGLVVLMIRPKEGIVIEGAGGYPKGHFSDIWDMNVFRPVYGTATISIHEERKTI